MSEEDKYSKSMKQIKSELKTNTVYFFNNEYSSPLILTIFGIFPTCPTFSSLLVKAPNTPSRSSTRSKLFFIDFSISLPFTALAKIIEFYNYKNLSNS